MPRGVLSIVPNEMAGITAGQSTISFGTIDLPAVLYETAALESRRERASMVGAVILAADRTQLLGQRTGN